jgi:hypothetical protein
MPSRAVIASFLLLAGISGCTWVSLTKEGVQVAVMNNVDASCKKLGTTTSIGRSEVASIDRNEEKVATELETLARNHAATMGGNAIVRVGPVTADGQQNFAVYNCP